MFFSLSNSAKNVPEKKVQKFRWIIKVGMKISCISLETICRMQTSFFLSLVIQP